MDKSLARFTRDQQIIGAGILVTLISLFFSWYSVSVSLGAFHASASASGFDLDRGKLIALFCLVALAALVALAGLVQVNVERRLLALAIGGLGALSFLIVLYTLLRHTSYTAFGIYLSLVASAVWGGMGLYVVRDDLTALRSGPRPTPPPAA
jgi:hypothetical protein